MSARAESDLPYPGARASRDFLLKKEPLRAHPEWALLLGFSSGRRMNVTSWALLAKARTLNRTTGSGKDSLPWMASVVTGSSVGPHEEKIIVREQMGIERSLFPVSGKLSGGLFINEHATYP